VTENVDKAVERIKSKYGEQRSREEKELLDEKLKSELGQQFFVDSHRKVTALVEEFNGKMGGQPVMKATQMQQDSYDLQVHAVRQEFKGVAVTYNPVTQQITIVVSPGQVQIATQQLVLGEDRRSMLATQANATSGVRIYLTAEQFSEWIFDIAASQL
jgi:hypothetical protein